MPTAFDCQAHAKTREYIYRLVVPKPTVLVPEGDLSLLPICELGRCHFHRDPSNNAFNLDKAVEATKMFVGRHDFGSFCSDNPVSKVRTVEEVAVNKLEIETHEEFDPLYKNVDIYEFYFRGRSFLFGQASKFPINHLPPLSIAFHSDSQHNGSLVVSGLRFHVPRTIGQLSQEPSTKCVAQ